MTQIEELSIADLRSATTVAAGTTTTRLIGTAEATATEQLHAFFDRLHQTCLGDNTRELVVDLSDVEFMTSACLKQFVTWFTAIEATPEDSQYKVRLRGSKGRPWQRRSLNALACFSVELITLEWND